jgi:hypothetical protein
MGLALLLAPVFGYLLVDLAKPIKNDQDHRVEPFINFMPQKVYLCTVRLYQWLVGVGMLESAQLSNQILTRQLV